MTTIRTRITPLLVAAAVLALAGLSRAAYAAPPAHIVLPPGLPLVMELVTPPLTGESFACMVTNVSKGNLKFKIEMWSAQLPIFPLNESDDCSTGAYPPGSGCRISIYAPEGVIYCRIKVYGTNNKDAVRGSLQARGGISDGFPWYGAVEAR